MLLKRSAYLPLPTITGKVIHKGILVLGGIIQVIGLSKCHVCALNSKQQKHFKANLLAAAPTVYPNNSLPSHSLQHINAIFLKLQNIEDGEKPSSRTLNQTSTIVATVLCPVKSAFSPLVKKV